MESFACGVSGRQIGIKIRDRSLRVPRALGAPGALRVSGPHPGPLGPLGPKPPFGFYINKKWRDKP